MGIIIHFTAGIVSCVNNGAIIRAIKEAGKTT